MPQSCNHCDGLRAFTVRTDNYTVLRAVLAVGCYTGMHDVRTWYIYSAGVRRWNDEDRMHKASAVYTVPVKKNQEEAVAGSLLRWYRGKIAAIFIFLCAMAQGQADFNKFLLIITINSDTI